MIRDRCTLLAVAGIKGAIAKVGGIFIRNTLLTVTCTALLSLAPARGSDRDRLAFSANVAVAFRAAIAAVAVSTFCASWADLTV